MSLASLAVAGALILEVVMGEPPEAIHPVAWFGRIVGRAERTVAGSRAMGVVLALVLPIGAAVLAGGGIWLAGTLDRRAALGLGAVVLFTTTSMRALLLTVRRVSRLAGRDLPAARDSLAALAGREASTLSATGVRSAALESLAENLSDGLVAPLGAFTLGAVVGNLAGFGAAGSLALAGACAVWLKAVNTMDSMVGYRDNPLGFGPARLDDLVMWLPARVTALLLAVWFLAPGALRRSADWAPGVASPNAGWPMGVLAAALGVRLEKPGAYVLNPDGAAPTHAHTRRALRRVGLAALSAYGLAGVIAWS